MNAANLHDVVCDHMLDYKNEFEPYCTGRGSFTEKVANLHLEGHWNSELSNTFPYAVAYLFQCNVVIYSSMQGLGELNISPILRDVTHPQNKQHTSLKYAFTAVPNHEHYDSNILGKRETLPTLNYKAAAPANHQQPTPKPQIIPDSNEGTSQENDQGTSVCFPDLQIGDDELSAIDIDAVIESLSTTNEFPKSKNFNPRR